MPLSSGAGTRISCAVGSACRSGYVSLDVSVPDVTGISGAPWTLTTERAAVRSTSFHAYLVSFASP